MTNKIIFAKQKVAFGAFASNSPPASANLLASIYGGMNGNQIRTDFALYHSEAEIVDFFSAANDKVESEWAVCYIDGIFSSDLKNILLPILSVISPLSSVFTLAAYESDFILFPKANQKRIEAALVQAGYEVIYLDGDIKLSSFVDTDQASSAIKHFSLEDLPLGSSSLERMKSWKSDLEPDEYLVRQVQIERLLSYSGEVETNDLLTDYYLHGSLDSLNQILRKYPTEIREEVLAMDSSRFRSISTFNLARREEVWDVYDAVPSQQRIIFPGQELGQVEEGRLEFRKHPRSFKKTDLGIQTSEEVAAFLTYVTLCAGRTNPDLWYLSVMMHLTDNRVADASRIVSNSPEGIHQDGFPYIISAFVIERENITGAESQIFQKDPKQGYKPVLASTLHPGMGIFQPDSGTNLWHLVTPMKPIAGKVGSRFTVGFDIDTHNRPFNNKWQKPMFSLPRSKENGPSITARAKCISKQTIFPQVRRMSTFNAAINTLRRLIK